MASQSQDEVASKMHVVNATAIRSGHRNNCRRTSQQVDTASRSLSYASASFFGKMSMEAMLERGSEALSESLAKGLATCDRSDLVKHDVRQHEFRVRLGTCSLTSRTVRGTAEFGYSATIPPRSVQVAVGKRMRVQLLCSTSPHLLNLRCASQPHLQNIHPPHTLKCKASMWLDMKL